MPFKCWEKNKAVYLSDIQICKGLLWSYTSACIMLFTKTEPVIYMLAVLGASLAQQNQWQC